MVKVCWDPWGRWNTGECTCSTLASAEGPPPCLGALITLIAFSLGPQPSNLTKSLHWWNWAENISNILVPAVHLLVLFVHLMKRCWSPHLLVTISLVSTCTLDNNWKIESIFFIYQVCYPLLLSPKLLRCVQSKHLWWELFEEGIFLSAMTW